MKNLPVNFFSVDLEDWHQCYAVRYDCPDKSASYAIEKLVDDLLALLHAHSVHATFFCLARLAEEKPQLIRNIAQCKHEIQSHGYSHRKVGSLSPSDFRADLQRSKAILEDIAGTKVCGFRAPEFSIDASCQWAFDVLHECGYSYDSSVFPLKMRRYGWRGFPMSPVSMKLANGARIIEFPIFVADCFHVPIPLGGGATSGCFLGASRPS